ncbi:MAG: hypothetical protein V3W41_01635 [Planctomycetota bacterium]
MNAITTEAPLEVWIDFPESEARTSPPSEPSSVPESTADFEVDWAEVVNQALLGMAVGFAVGMFLYATTEIGPVAFITVASIGLSHATQRVLLLTVVPRISDRWVWPSLLGFFLLPPLGANAVVIGIALLIQGAI